MPVTASTRLGITRWSDDADPVEREQFDADHALLDDLVAIDLQGTLAARPAASIRGRYYYATDNGLLYRDTGAAWATINGVPAASSVTFTPVGGIASTNVQDAIAELDTEKAADSAVVKLTGDQTVAGVKTFSSRPLLPASSPTTDNEAVRKKYVDDLAVPKALFDANTFLAATVDDTPVAVAVAEQRILGRKTGGAITALTGAEVLAIAGAAQVAVGSYTGNGADSRTISLTFTPKFVVAVNEDDADAYLLSQVNTGTVTAAIRGSAVLQHKGIEAGVRPTTNGFLVGVTGSSANANENAKTFHYFAIG